MTSGRWEKVHTVHDYYDGPVSGVADVNGVPHVFEKIFSEEEDEYIDCYLVMTIDQELYAPDHGGLVDLHSLANGLRRGQDHAGDALCSARGSRSLSAPAAGHRGSMASHILTGRVN
ncbi:MAG TPA: hypothetical protein VFE34_10755 [Dongiaceae bacterium]|jgi:hypothetical protein|nr:hypothetical protein [Dongiaceae bacterium]